MYFCTWNQFWDFHETVAVENFCKQAEDKDIMFSQYCVDFTFVSTIVENPGGGYCAS